ncbi:sodium channel and clathrin linker 1-like isoform X2 [Stigmatopora nigra]
MTDVKLKMESDAEETDWFQRDLVEPNHPQMLPMTSGVDSSTAEKNENIYNYETQVQLFNQERMQVTELWQTAGLEMDELQEIYQKIATNEQNTNTTEQQLPANCNFSKTMTGHNKEMEDLQTQLKTTKSDLRTAMAKVDDLTHQLQTLQQQLNRQEDDKTGSWRREEGAQREIEQLQTTIRQQETRIKTTSLEAETALKDQTMWENTAGNLKARCAALEQEKYEGLEKVRECLQMAEEAALQKDEAQLRAKQLTQELQKTKKGFQQFIHNATLSSNKELTTMRQQYNNEMQHIAEELSRLQLDCVDKQSQIEKAKREKKALEEELTKVTKCKFEHGLGKIDALHQRCLKAERIREDLNISLQSTQSKLKKMEVEHNQELSLCQDEVEQLKSYLTAAREDSVGISYERLQLQQENVQFRKEMDELRKAFLLVQEKTKQKMTQMEQEYLMKEKSLKAKMTELEDTSRNSSADLMSLVTAQQKSIHRWKVEAPKMVHSFESKIKNLTHELKQHQHQSYEFQIQLTKNNNTNIEYERQFAEFKEKKSNLQDNPLKLRQLQ